MSHIRLLEKMRDFLNGNISPEEFAFEFEQDLNESAYELKNENEELFLLLNDDMPELCANFEPDNGERLNYSDVYHNENHLRRETNKVYIEALELLTFKKATA